jgi:ABC-2 type transport system ATP-binding protein
MHLAASDVVLAVQGARKRFGATLALDGVSLEVRRGEWVGLLGPNGAGKTTLVRAIAGRVRLDGGDIRLDGAVAGEPAATARIGLVPQENALYPFLTARENLEVFGCLHGVPRGALAERVGWALAWAGLVERADDRTDGFSGGMQRRLNLACGVLHRPDLVLLDEPTTGVDPQSRQRIFVMLDDLRRAGTSLLHTTHQLQEAEGLCTRVVIVDHGRIVTEGTPDELIARTLGRVPEVVVTLDRAPAPEVLAAGVQADGQVVRAALADLAVELPALLARLHAAGHRVDDVRVVRGDLHAVFLQLTGHELRE